MNYFLVCSMTEKSVQSGRNIQIKCVTQTELKLMRSFTSYVVPVRERSFRDIQMDTDLSRCRATPFGDFRVDQNKLERLYMSPG